MVSLSCSRLFLGYGKAPTTECDGASSLVVSLLSANTLVYRLSRFVRCGCREGLGVEFVGVFWGEHVLFDSSPDAVLYVSVHGGLIVAVDGEFVVVERSCGVETIVFLEVSDLVDGAHSVECDGFHEWLDFVCLFWGDVVESTVSHGGAGKCVVGEGVGFHPCAFEEAGVDEVVVCKVSFLEVEGFECGVGEVARDEACVVVVVFADALEVTVSEVALDEAGRLVFGAEIPEAGVGEVAVGEGCWCVSGESFELDFLDSLEVAVDELYFGDVVEGADAGEGCGEECFFDIACTSEVFVADDDNVFGGCTAFSSDAHQVSPCSSGCCVFYCRGLPCAGGMEKPHLLRVGLYRW